MTSTDQETGRNERNPTPFYLRLLGGFSLTRAGRPVTHFESDKARALLAYLALEKRPLRREHLAGLLWADKTERRARGNLSRVLSNLRDIAPGYLLGDRHTVQFNRDQPHWIDVEAFQARYQAASTSGDDEAARVILTQAAELYRGEFLEGFSLSGCLEFEEWSVIRREQLHQIAVRVFYVLAQRGIERGDTPAALAHLDRLLALEPWREEAHRQRMLLLARAGQRSAALHQYERCRSVLQEALGIEPTAKTTALYDRIRAVGRRSRRTLRPLTSTSFVGRLAELAEIGRRLAASDCRLLTLVGPGGVGKSRLAMEAGAQNQHLFLDGVVWVPLAGIATDALLPTAIAQALNLPLSGRVPASDQLLGHLVEQELLLILDNFEHLLDGAPFLPRILRRAPRVKLLVTSRERLSLRDEWVVRLDGLRTGDGDAAQDESPAVELFIRRARQAGWQEPLSPATNASMRRICSLLEGLPLAVELAAALAAHLPAAEIAHRLEEDLDLLASPLRDLPPRHRSLRAVFNSAWAGLTGEEQQTLVRLSIFQGGFERHAARSVTGASQRLLDILAGKSLLERPDDDRYSLHKTIQQFAAEHLPALGVDEGDLRAAHGRYYTSFLHRQEVSLKSERQREALDAIATEIDNVRAAWDWAVEERRPREIAQGVTALGLWYEIRGWMEESQATFDRTVEALRAMDDSAVPATRLALGRALVQCGIAHAHFGQHEASIAHIEEGLRVLRSLDAPGDVAGALVHLGQKLQNTSRFQEALRCVEEALTTLRPLGDRWEIAHALKTLGNLYYDQGMYDDATRHYEESATICEAAGDHRGLAAAFNNLGNVAYERGDFETSEAWHQRSLEIKRSLDDRWGITTSLYNLGELAYLRGRYDEAEPLLVESSEISREIGYHTATAAALNRLGDLKRVQGEAQQAEDHYRASLRVSQGTENENRVATSLQGLARLSLDRGDAATARQHLVRALRLPVTPPTALDTLSELVGVLAMEERREGAMTLALFVRDHPATGREARDRMAAQVEMWRRTTPRETMERVSARVASRTLEEVVEEIFVEE